MQALILQARERAILDKKYSKFDGNIKVDGTSDKGQQKKNTVRKREKKRYAGISSGSSCTSESSDSDYSSNDDSNDY